MDGDAIRWGYHGLLVGADDGCLEMPGQGEAPRRLAARAYPLVERWMQGIDAPPFWRTFLKRPGLVGRWQVCRFSLPANVMIEVGVAPTGTGAPQGDRSQGIEGVNPPPSRRPPRYLGNRCGRRARPAPHGARGR